MATNKLRVGVIGANVDYGWAPRTHLPALPDFELAAVCTAHEETARASAEKFGAPLAFHDHQEMLRNPDIDVVAVVVRVPLHHRLTMDALEAGKHVFTEWPLGANLQEAQQMADLARTRGVHTMVGLQARCAPVFLRVKELVDEGYVGEVLSCHMTQFGGGAFSRSSSQTWNRDRAMGATTLSIAFGHAIDALRMCLGELQEVSAVVSTQVPQWHERDTDRMVDVTASDNVLVSGRLASGTVVAAHVGSISTHGSGFKLEVYGREGTLVVTSDGGAQTGDLRLLGAKSGDPALQELPIPERLTWVPEAVPQGPAINVGQMWGRFGDAIRNGKTAEPDFDTAVTLHRLLDAIQAASDTGQRQGA